MVLILEKVRFVEEEVYAFENYVDVFFEFF